MSHQQLHMVLFLHVFFTSAAFYLTKRLFRKIDTLISPREIHIDMTELNSNNISMMFFTLKKTHDQVKRHQMTTKIHKKGYKMTITRHIFIKNRPFKT